MRQALEQLLYASFEDTHCCVAPHHKPPYVKQLEQVDVADAHSELPLVEQEEEELEIQLIGHLLYADEPYWTHCCVLPHQ